MPLEVIRKPAVLAADLEGNADFVVQVRQIVESDLAVDLYRFVAEMDHHAGIGLFAGLGRHEG